jgi:two-component system sensor histidine kinase EvgS
MEIDPRIPKGLLLDEVRLRQVLFNSIGNAVKFTDRGVIRLSAVRLDEDNKSARPGPDNRVDIQIRVADTGIGISKESLKTIFDAFKQQDGQNTKKYGGTGLGLAITKRLVEMMGGTITAESEEGKGAVFTIRFPRVAVAPPEEILADVTIPSAPILAFSPAVILVVDDIDNNRALLAAYSSGTGLKLLEAVDGKEAVELAASARPDAVLMDIRMPIMDGFEATRRMKSNPALRDIPVIALTASGMKEDEERIRQTGFDGFLMKPVKRADLLQELARFLDHREGETGAGPAGTEIPGPEYAAVRPEIVDILETQGWSRWEKARQSGFFDDIADFGKTVRNLGKTEEVEILYRYGVELIQQVERFDIENLNRNLSRFPEILAAVKSAIGQHPVNKTAGTSSSQENIPTAANRNP